MLKIHIDGAIHPRSLPYLTKQKDASDEQRQRQKERVEFMSSQTDGDKKT